MSRRLGRDKCQVVLGDTTIVGHVLRAAHQAVAEVVVVGRCGQDAAQIIPPEFQATTTFVTDRRPDCGPLEGLRAGLASLPSTIRYACLCGGDCPFITPDFIGRLLSLATDVEAAVPWIDGKYAPIPAAYATVLEDRIEKLLEGGERRLWRLVEQSRVRQVFSEDLVDIDPELQSLINVNDPLTLARAEKQWPRR